MPQLSYVDPGSDLSLSPTERDQSMIVIGTDTHKASHTVAALDEATGRVLADRTVRGKRRSFEDLLRWARRLGGSTYGPSRTAGTSRARSSGSCSPAASRCFGSRRS